jgi:hypothetical protein
MIKNMTTVYFVTIDDDDRVRQLTHRGKPTQTIVHIPKHVQNNHRYVAKYLKSKYPRLIRSSTELYNCLRRTDLTCVASSNDNEKMIYISSVPDEYKLGKVFYIDDEVTDIFLRYAWSKRFP